MDRINKILRIGILLTVVFLIFSILFVYYIRLDHPVFLKHYYEYNIQKIENDDGSCQGTAQFTLQYITNTSDTRQISYIKFKEEPDILFYANSQSGFFYMMNSTPSLGTKYGRYSFRSTNLFTDSIDLDKVKKDFILSHAQIYFTNGDNMEADIGKVIFYINQTEAKYLSGRGQSSSSDGTSSIDYIIAQDITLTKIDSPFLDDLSSCIHLDANGKDMRNINGMILHSQDALRINTSLKSPQDSKLEFTNYDLQPKLYYKDSAGNESYAHIKSIGNSGYHKLSFFKILSYVKWG